MKQRKIFVFLLAVCLMLSACGHTHAWQAANCTSPKICPECGETEGDALGHSWQEATCTQSKVCDVCGLTGGEALGHTWNDATCTAPKTCGLCGMEEGASLGHTWNAATCVEPESCSVCGAKQGEALGHAVETWSVVTDSSCTQAGIENGVCAVCAETVEQQIPLKEHTPGEWEITVQPTPDSEGTHIRKCTACGAELEKEQFSLSEEELKELYKSNCRSIDYDDLARTPGDYEGEYVKFRGKVVQVCYEAESALYYSSYRVATSGSYDDVIYIKVDNYGSGTRILEDDWITIYGEYDGLYTYETVMGASRTIPCIVVEYVE